MDNTTIDSSRAPIISNPPAHIQGIVVRHFARVEGRCRWTKRCRHYKDGVLIGPVPRLAIVQAGSVFYLFGCDDSWGMITKSHHHSLEDTKRQAEYEYEGVGACWEIAPVPPVASSATEVPPEPTCSGPAVAWCGHLTDYSGFAKANREILFRIANVLSVNVLRTGLEGGFLSLDRGLRARIDSFRDIHIPERAPLLRFFGPDYKGDPKRYRICWTMMETYRIHEDMVRLLNDNYEELWTPTEWNRQVFLESGVRIPSRTMHLGVNPLIYHRIKGATLPTCRLLTSDKAGSLGTPDGFVFITVGLPSFRKGFDVLVEAFEKAFGNQKDVHLVLAITHSLVSWNREIYKQFAEKKINLWTLEGSFTEHELARAYSASQCYVSASRGEGWNLPLCEAAACGIPVIAPDNTSHPEVLRGKGLLFPTEGIAPHPEAHKVSAWYKGMPFAVFGRTSVNGLAEAMRSVALNGSRVAERMKGLRTAMATHWNWDRAAHQVTRRLLELQP